MRKTTIDMIEANCHDVREKMYKMIDSWLRRQSTKEPEPTWNRLIRALSESVGITTAKNIARNFVCNHQ